MTTNEKISSDMNIKISKWLGLEIFEEGKYIYKVERYETHERFAKTKKLIKLDFLHDRNQQKWIEDEMIKDGYEIEYAFVDGLWGIDVWHIKEDIYQRIIVVENQSKDTTFIEAVLELIDKEGENE